MRLIRRHPVEDQQHNLVGIISYRTLLRLVARGRWSAEEKQVSVSEVMKRDPITVAPGASTLEAIDLMRFHKVSCLPVVGEGQLVGIITERDLMDVAAELLKQQLRE